MIYENLIGFDVVLNVVLFFCLVQLHQPREQTGVQHYFIEFIWKLSLKRFELWTYSAEQKKQNRQANRLLVLLGMTYGKHCSKFDFKWHPQNYSMIFIGSHRNFAIECSAATLRMVRIAHEKSVHAKIYGMESEKAILKSSDGDWIKINSKALHQRTHKIVNYNTRCAC